MKTRHLALTVTAAFLAAGAATAQVPTGKLSINDQVQVGTKPDLAWKIVYPEEAADLIELTPTKRLRTNKRIHLEVRVLGVAFQSGRNHLPVALHGKIGGQAWQKFFEGRYYNVDPETPVFDGIVEAGTEINFLGQGKGSNGRWYDERSTLEADVALTALFNGDTVPDYAPAYDQGNIESFLSQYISPGNLVTIGSQDIIYLFELATRNTGASYFDMQDLVVLITYTEVVE